MVEQVARRSGFNEIVEMIENKTFAENPLVEMPWEVVLHILSFLEPYDLCTVFQVCVRLAELSSEDALWRRFCPPDSASSGDKGRQSVKDKYMEWLRPNLKFHAQSRLTTDLPADPNSPVKVILVGDSGVGKTHLFSIASKNAVPPVEPTIGVDFANRLFVHPSLSQPVKIQFWDTAGQERFRSIVVSFFQYVSASVLVYNVASPKSLASIRDYWSASVKLLNYDNSDKPRVILVGIEDAPGVRGRPRAVSEAEGRAVAHEIGALWWMEIALGRASTAKAVERLVSGLADSSQFDPFTQLRCAAACGEEGTTALTSWHVPSAELCGALLSRSNVAARLSKGKEQEAKEDNDNAGRSCVLQ